MAELPEVLDLSSSLVDAWSAPGGPPTDPTVPSTNRISNEVSELVDGVAIVESFSHMINLRTDDGLVVFDASSVFTGKGAVESLRTWSDEPVHTLVYTHGHVDHVGGSVHLMADAEARGHGAPAVVGHENIPARFARYRETDGWNLAINARQFGPDFGGGMTRKDGSRIKFLPEDTLECTELYREAIVLEVGGLELHLHHARGETDDHTWAWIPAHKAIVVGDLVWWNFPNAGNPQKVQRYPGEWAAALRQMLALEPELMLPAHGLPVIGKERVATILNDVATALETLVADVVALMNQGATLDDIVHTVRVDPEVLARPWMRPTYDEPEFVVRNTYRLYGGWWDGDPSHLKPAPAIDLARELADLAGGADTLAERAQTCAEVGDLRLACQLIELAARASEDPEIWRVRSQLYRDRAHHETSLMAKGVYNEAARSGDERVASLEAGPDA